MSFVEDLEREAREEAKASREVRLVVAQIALIFVACLLVGVFLYSSQFSGTIRWVLGSCLLLVIAVSGWLYVARRTAEPAPLLSPAGRRRLDRGDLSGLSAVVGRARKGLSFSQVLLSSRVRDVLVERASLAYGLPVEAVRSAQLDRTRLHELFHDPELEDFLYLRTSDSVERSRWVQAARDAAGFDVGMKRILDRMEAWR